MTGRYPLTWRSAQAGLMLGVVAGSLANSLLVGYAVLVLCVCAGLTWRRDEAPVFPFILAFQWMQVTCGHFLFLATGDLPPFMTLGEFDTAIQTGLTGLLILAAGIRVVSELTSDPNDTEGEQAGVRNVRGLFWLVIVLYAFDYVNLVAGAGGFGGFNRILDPILDVRLIPLLLLWREVLRVQRHKSYLWISLAWVFVPKLGSYYADFKTPLFLLIIVLASAWKPWLNRWWRFSLSDVLRTAIVVSATIFMGLLWEGAGVKKGTREAFVTRSTNPIERVELFFTHATAAVPTIVDDPKRSLEAFVGRFWYVQYFSRVLEYVPAVEPFAGGELLQMAMTNALMPRMLFPDKPVLPSDSYYTRRFTGINVPDQNTDISIGYMAEFYADWGLSGMFVSVFFYGALIGGAAELVRRLVRPRILIDPALMTVLLTVSFFEHQFIRTFAAMNIAFIITVGAVWILGGPFARFVGLENEATPGGDTRAPVGWPPVRSAAPRIEPAARNPAL